MYRSAVASLALTLLAASNVQSQTVLAAQSERRSAASLPVSGVAPIAASPIDMQTVVTPAQLLVQTTPGDGRQGTFKIVRGDVALITKNMRSIATPGGGIRQGDQITVGDNSSVAVTLRDGTTLTLGSNTSVTLTRYQFEPTTQDGSIGLSLFRGAMRVVTGLITHGNSESGPAKVKVTTPTAVIGVRGTDVVIDADS